MAARSIGTLLAVYLLSGCLSLPGPSHGGPAFSAPVRSWGLGLEVPSELPPLGAFWENASEIERLESFLAHDGVEILRECGQGNASEVLGDLAQDYHLTAIEDVYHGCSQSAYRDDEVLVGQARASGTEAAVYQRLRADALAALERAQAALDRFEGPGTVVEAEVLYKIVNRHLFDRESVNTAANSFAGYEEDRRPINLENAYLQLLVPSLESNVTLQLLQRYPWTRPVCEAPDLDALSGRYQAKYDHALALAKSYAQPGDEEWVSNMYGSLLKVTGPRFEFSRDHGYWASLLGGETYLNWDVGYLENYTASKLPTREEASYLVAQYRNSTRTLVTEYDLSSLLGQLDFDYPWEGNEWQPIRALTVSSLGWEFDQLRCNAPSTS